MLQVKVVGPHDNPVANEPVYLSIDNSQNVVLNTDVKGLASFSLDTSSWKDTVSLQAS